MSAASSAAPGSPLDRIGVGRALREIAALLELAGGQKFRVRAYLHAAESIESLKETAFETLVREDRLTEVPGVGAAIASQVTTLARDGTSSTQDKLRASMPKGALELASIKGMTRKRIEAVASALGVDSIAALEAACEAGRVRTVPGFGPKTEASLLAALRSRAVEEATTPPRLILAEATEEADALAAFARACAGVGEVETAGEVRRGLEIVDRIDVVVAADDPRAAREELASYPRAASSSSTESVLDLHLRSRIHAFVHVVTASAFAEVLFETTGPAAHVAEVKALRGEGGAAPAHEEDVYREAKRVAVPPELRDDPRALDDASAPEAFADLLTARDVRGMLHCHTTFSDGKHDVLAMAQAAEALGMEYIAITDHSPTAHYAGGLDLDRLRAQWDAIAAAQEKVKIRILRGTESDILVDGALDYPDAILEQLDVVIASIHVRNKLGEEAMTERVVRAMRLPIFKIWGHPLGRILLHRDPIAVRFDPILDALASSPAAIEVNGDPHRLDLPPDWIRLARERGIPFVVSVDAHSTRSLGYLRWAVTIARRGGLRKSEVLNTLAPDAFARAVAPGARPAT